MRYALFFLVAFLMPVAASAASAPQKEIDKLFAQLGKTQSAEDANPIEAQIVSIFAQSGSPSVDLLMTRALSAEQGGDAGTAKTLFESITDIAPGFAEGWHQRAELQMRAGDDEGAMLSLQKAITLNPRQFTALAELAGLLAEYGDKPAALAMYRKALALDPQLEGVVRHVQELTHQVEGERI